MDPRDDRFAVYLRSEREERAEVEAAERPVATVPSYEEARRVRRWYRDSGQNCVIRYLGDVGGGD
jgi:hypothetical protein